jgi:hypothetical protein
MLIQLLLILVLYQPSSAKNLKKLKKNKKFRENIFFKWNNLINSKKLSEKILFFEISKRTKLLKNIKNP